MAAQAFQCVVRFIGVHDLHQLDFFELVLAYHAARIASVRAGLAAEAGGVRDILQRQLFQRRDGVAHHVGHRNFGGGDQVEIFYTCIAHMAWHFEQIFFKFWQLAGATHRLRIYQIRHISLGVAMLVGVSVEHELRQSTVHACQRAFQQRETRAADLGRGFKIQPHRFADADMVFYFEIKFWRRADLAHFHIVRLGFTLRYAVMRCIGDH